MKHLVLGSSGQIGNYVVEYFKAHGEDVIEFDIQRSIDEDIRISNNIILENRIKDCDIIHFLAFDIGGAKYLEKYQNSYTFISNNMKIMVNVFEFVKKYNKPIIFASSQMSELTHSTYGQLKSIGEKITKDLGGIAIRLWNVYGYESFEEKAHVITDFIKMAKYDGVIKMRTDGTESRQLLYAEDCAECMLMLSKNYHTLNKDKNYHITSFEWVTIMDVANIISDISNCKIESSNKKDNTQKNAMNNADDYILNLWKPKTSLKDGIYKLYKKY